LVAYLAVRPLITVNESAEPNDREAQRLTVLRHHNLIDSARLIVDQLFVVDRELVAVVVVVVVS
jgi:hypothetical protein